MTHCCFPSFLLWRWYFNFLVLIVRFVPKFFLLPFLPKLLGPFPTLRLQGPMRWTRHWVWCTIRDSGYQVPRQGLRGIAFIPSWVTMPFVPTLRLARTRRDLLWPPNTTWYVMMPLSWRMALPAFSGFQTQLLKRTNYRKTLLVVLAGSVGGSVPGVCTSQCFWDPWLFIKSLSYLRLPMIVACTLMDLDECHPKQVKTFLWNNLFKIPIISNVSFLAGLSTIISLRYIFDLVGGIHLSRLLAPRS